MAFGLPILATRVGGLNDILADGLSGYFINQRDSNDISGKIEILLNDLQLTRSIAIQNRWYAAEHFSAGRVLERLEQIYHHYAE